jgi:predicted phosphohydrolase
VERLKEGFSEVREEDTVILCGDLSWGMSLQEAEKDFAFLDHELPGEKWILKGNHDYWWGTANKMNSFFQEKGFTHLHILHNNCTLYGETALCGTRGWFFEENGSPHWEKVFNRELIRLEASLKAAAEREKICFLHYPPLYKGYRCEEIIELMTRYGVKACYYGHLHGPSHRLAIQGMQDEINYQLVAADFIGFKPKKILE